MQTSMISSTHRRFWRLTLLAIVLYILAFSILTIGRYDRYNATGFDLAFYDQILWRTANGDIMGMSIEGNNWTNWAFHVEPILLLIAPFKLIFIDVRWLLMFQTVILAIGAIPVYRIAMRQWQKPWAGFFFALLYLLYPTVGWANKFDFHPLTLTTPLLLFAWDAAELKRFRRVSVLLLLALLCKEEVGFVVALFGLYWYFAKDRWRTGLIWAVVGIVWTLVSLFVIIPGAQSATALPYQATLRYDWLFHGSIQQKVAYITGPDTGVKIRFLIQLLFPLAFAPLLKPRILAIASPILVLSLLSAKLDQSSIFHQYMADVIPFLMVAAIKGVPEAGTLVRRIGLRLRPPLVHFIFFTAMATGTLLMFVLFGPFTFIPREPYTPIYGWESGASLEGLHVAESLIPADSCLTTANNIAAHYGQRKEIYALGIGNFWSCSLVLIDLADQRYLSFDGQEPRQFACQQFETANFQPTFYQDNVVILRRDAPPTRDLSARFAAYCATLRAS